MIGRAVLAIVGPAILLSAGCDATAFLIGLTQPDTTTVRLVNQADYAVRVELLIADEQDVPEDAMAEVGSELDYTVPAGETTAFSRKCDHLQAIMVDDSQPMVIGGAGPHADSGVLRDGSDFGCGDTIVFTFEHSNLLIDFRVSANVQEE